MSHFNILHRPRQSIKVATFDTIISTLQILQLQHTIPCGNLLPNNIDYFANETGAVNINPLKTRGPNLIFETDAEDHLIFLCYYDYSRKP